MRSILTKERQDNLKHSSSHSVTINTVLSPKEKLRYILYCQSHILDKWCLLEDTSKLIYNRRFIKKLKHYSCGITNHSDFHIHTRKSNECEGKSHLLFVS